MRNYQSLLLTPYSLLLVLTLFWGCQASLTDNLGTSGLDTSGGSGLAWELAALTSEDDLNVLLARSDEGIVDWQLSREFAEMALGEFIAEGDYPPESELWDIPIAIYDDEGEVRYYEFRIVDGEQTLGAITGNAREDRGAPVSHVFDMDGYADELNALYASGALSANDIPRIVDNDYPSYAVASVAVTRSGNVNLKEIIDPSTGERLENLDVLLDLEESIAAYPDAFSPEEVEAARDGLENYKAEMSELWKAAKANKGSLHNFVFRGKPSRPRTSVDSGRIEEAVRGYKRYPGNDQYGKYSYGSNTWGDTKYNACGSTAIGFVLDFIHGNNIENLDNWKGMNHVARRSKLESLMRVNDWPKGAVMPWHLEYGLRYFSSYTTSLSLGVVPKRSIHNNMPGISMRWFRFDRKNSEPHWRNVVAYQNRGWWIFTWTFIHIYDGNGVDHGDWEAWNPFYHSFTFDVVRR